MLRMTCGEVGQRPGGVWYRCWGRVAAENPGKEPVLWPRPGDAAKEAAGTETERCQRWGLLVLVMAGAGD